MLKYTNAYWREIRTKIHKSVLNHITVCKQEKNKIINILAKPLFKEKTKTQ